MKEQARETRTFEVFAWGHGYVGTRATIEEARRLGIDYEGARILLSDDSGFKVVAELGRFAEWRAQKRGA